MCGGSFLWALHYFVFFSPSVALRINRSSEITRDEYEQIVNNALAAVMSPAPEYASHQKGVAVSGLTMQSRENLLALKAQLEDIVDRGVSGDIYETGCWRGGTSIFMIKVLDAYEKLKGAASHRMFWLFDSFEGFPTTGDAATDGYLQHMSGYAAPLDMVKTSFKNHDVLDETRVHFTKGWFNETLPKLVKSQMEMLGHAPNMVAVLRMDGDLYSSTKDTLDNLEQHVNQGGLIIIDDYMWTPPTKNGREAVCKQAVDEYRTNYAITKPIEYYPGNGYRPAYWIKAKK